MLDSAARGFDRAAKAVAWYAGRPVPFLVAVLAVVAWAFSGPFFGFSQIWQLIINTSTTIITFLMVFLIQNTQNRDTEALQLKLDELIRVTNARNELMNAEHMSVDELQAAKDQVTKGA
jgi:low affinity Fe/Cu permease